MHRLETSGIVVSSLHSFSALEIWGHISDIRVQMPPKAMIPSHTTRSLWRGKVPEGKEQMHQGQVWGSSRAES